MKFCVGLANEIFSKENLTLLVAKSNYVKIKSHDCGTRPGNNTLSRVICR